MKQPKLFFLLLLCITLSCASAVNGQNINPNAYYYTSMAEALAVKQDTNSIVQINAPNV
jgi:hypothetical protein